MDDDLYSPHHLGNLNLQLWVLSCSQLCIYFETEMMESLIWKLTYCLRLRGTRDSRKMGFNYRFSQLM